MSLRILSLVFGHLLLACASTGQSAPPPECPAAPICPICPTSTPSRPPTRIDPGTITTDRQRNIELIAFSNDGKRALVRVADRASGEAYQQLDLDISPIPKIEKIWRIEEYGEEAARAKALKALKPHAGPPSQQNASGITLLAADDGADLALYALKGERAIPIARIPRLMDEDERPSEINVPKLAWDPSGTRALIIHEQVLTADQGFQSAFLHVFPVPADALPF
jgi:hypothetical protein